MELFLDEFSNLIDNIIGLKLQNSTRKVGKSIPEKIKDDIRLGKPYLLIMAIYNKKRPYIQKIAHSMKGENLPDRRTTEWVGMQFKTR